MGFAQHYWKIVCCWCHQNHCMKMIILKHHSALVNYIEIMINRVHVIVFFFFFFAIADLKLISLCNVIQLIKKPLPYLKKNSVGLYNVIQQITKVGPYV